MVVVVAVVNETIIIDSSLDNIYRRETAVFSASSCLCFDLFCSGTRVRS